jgi:RecB family exonuclease
VARVDGDRYLLKAPQRRAAAPAAQSAPWPAPPEFPRFRESSITEIAAFQFCPLFHRRKYVLNWDDRIVELWPKPPGSFKKMAFKAGQPKDPETVRVGKLLKKLKLEKKERGIALHRVLERVKNVTEGLELAPLWLLEAYEAQGANGSDARLAELIALDVELLRHFLTSPLGREVFDETAEAYPEISFEWNVGGVRLHGAMDRLIRKPGGEWIVVDYKSSILEESLDRYRFQVESYMAAVSARESAPGAGKEKSAPPVAGYLVDLYAAKEHLVRKDAHDAVSQLEKELRETAKNYTPAGTKPNLVDGAVASGEHCFSCPYSLHCEIGKPFVLA